MVPPLLSARLASISSRRNSRSNFGERGVVKRCLKLGKAARIGEAFVKVDKQRFPDQ
jgi:hypothetical protein